MDGYVIYGDGEAMDLVQVTVRRYSVWALSYSATRLILISLAMSAGLLLVDCKIRLKIDLQIAFLYVM